MAQRRLERVLPRSRYARCSLHPLWRRSRRATSPGTVKDAQGGVVPGATVVLVSETKGTKSAPCGDERHR